jgi:hypothetical protein
MQEAKETRMKPLNLYWNYGKDSPKEEYVTNSKEGESSLRNW